jgi:mRNA-degrading endonuclease YafQ of YafQ-DinJ toxin-antitoxin module
MMNKTENTLYILQNLSSTESRNLDYAEIDIYYEDEQGNEGAAQYDMPAIADDAISTINELQSKIAKLEKELSGIVSGLFSENELAIRDLEHTRQGFWLGFEDARCHPDEMNILQQWEGTKRFNQAKALKDQS